MTLNLTETDRIKLESTRSLFDIMQRILLREDEIDRNREHLWVAGLESNNRILFIELVSLGTVNRTIAEPMEVFSFALQKRAAKIILVHNHPTGDLTPSAADKDNTDRFIQVGLIVNTPVLDHFIISEKSYLSFADIGLIDELSLSTKYVPSFLLEARMKEQARELANAKKANKKLASEERIKIAKGMKKEGVKLATIKKITGLSEEEIRKIK